MSNFTFLQSTPAFASFAPVAVAAEKILPIDPSAAVINCRRAMEFAVKWMYSVDGSLVLPFDDRLASLMDNEDFRDVVGMDLWRRMDYIRRLGNQAAHNSRNITREQAALCLENLHCFLDFVAYCYADTYEPQVFDSALLDAPAQPAPVVDNTTEIELKKLMAENAALREELTARREAQQPTYVPKPLDLSEYKTRKIYIDAMLIDAGWVEGRDWLNEVELPGMPNHSEVGYADYVLYDDMHKPLAIIEAKRMCVDASKGRQQAKLYADILEKQHGRRPVVFLTNGFDTFINDGQYPERRVSCIYAKRDLEKLFNLRRMRMSLANATVNKAIAGRYYQEGAIKAVCEAFDQKNRRKALLVMARTIESAVTLFVEELHARAAEVVVDDVLCGFLSVRAVREGDFRGVLGGDAFALVDVEDIVVSQERDFLLFVGFFVFLLYPFPEDHHVAFLALLDVPASFLALLEGQILTRAAK